ncbi:DUF1311 domain-containing protein [Acinetobacter sp. 194]|uniref:lysozyme inhibitor LprI family protein n=1 Tax=Acinetobacter shaoyimingii TaxID=2715164 RepID=UPI001407F15D|nr:lysozyme inhibitor LprI family protein [Acinetobacter shaoyimingii]NHB57662.1 DUF1311 domain-containing protein [Acinetobacter shaoyimingii]
MIKKIIGLVVLTVSSFQVTYAQDIKWTKHFKPCLDRSGKVTSSTMDCLGMEVKFQDARLNKAYQSLLSTLESNRKKELQTAQRLWVKYRDVHCYFYGDIKKGDLARMANFNCVLEQTSLRAQDLESLKLPE